MLLYFDSQYITNDVIHLDNMIPWHDTAPIIISKTNNASNHLGDIIVSPVLLQNIKKYNYIYCSNCKTTVINIVFNRVEGTVVSQ